MIRGLCLLIIIVISIFLYGSYRCNHLDYDDPLERKLHILELDGWSLSHFILFMILGFFYPAYLPLWFVLGCLWELCEYIFKSVGGKRCQGVNPRNDKWWYSRWSDIFVNTGGLLTGLTLGRF